jgi:oligopeptide/dipeptide ABC transporter ATP-binding protein
MTAAEASRPLLSIRGLSVAYSRGRRRPPLTALQDLDLDVRPGQTLGIVGESGSGKSTLGNAILGAVKPSGGRILFQGEDITEATKERRRELTKDIQVVFQDPFGSLNPMRTIGQTMEEPLIVHRPDLKKRERRVEIEAALTRVGLGGPDADRYPANFSGGQRQRIAIARALLLRPRLIVCDEAVSALDLSVQAKILNLLASLQKELGVAYLFISHDMAVIRHMSSQVLVLYQGRPMESGPADQICRTPRHPYTQRLLAAAPVPDPARQRLRHTEDRATAIGPPPPTGCPFRLQCSQATSECTDPLPTLRIGTTELHCHHGGPAQASPARPIAPAEAEDPVHRVARK